MLESSELEISCAVVLSELADACPAMKAAAVPPVAPRNVRRLEFDWLDCDWLDYDCLDCALSRIASPSERERMARGKLPLLTLGKKRAATSSFASLSGRMPRQKQIQCRTIAKRDMSKPSVMTCGLISPAYHLTAGQSPLRVRQQKRQN